MPLVGFTIETYYDARPYERQKYTINTEGHLLVIYILDLTDARKMEYIKMKYKI